jgi:hypothetical protein
LGYTPHYTLALMGRHRRELVDAEAGVYRFDQLVVLRGTRMPAVLFEAGSIINRQEEAEMASPERRSFISAAAAAAIEDFCAARSHPLGERPQQRRARGAAAAAARSGSGRSSGALCRVLRCPPPPSLPPPSRDNTLAEKTSGVGNKARHRPIWILGKLLRLRGDRP